MLGMQLAADQVVTERPDGRMGILGRSKRGMTDRKEFAKANGEFAVGGVIRNDRGDLNKWLVAHIITHQNSNMTRVTQGLAELVR